MKISVSIPDDLFRACEQLAQRLGLSRTELYGRALSAFLDNRSAAAVTAKLNLVHANQSLKQDPAFAGAQVRRLADEAW